MIIGTEEELEAKARKQARAQQQRYNIQKEKKKLKGNETFVENYETQVATEEQLDRINDLFRPAKEIVDEKTQKGEATGEKVLPHFKRIYDAESSLASRAIMVSLLGQTMEFAGAFNSRMFSLRKLKSDDDLCDRLNQFFGACKDYGITPNIERLAAFLLMSPGGLSQLKNGKKLFSWQTEATPMIIGQAYTIIAALDADLAMLGQIDRTVYIFRSKNFYDMSDNVTHTIKAETLTAATDAKTLVAMAEALEIDTYETEETAEEAQENITTPPNDTQEAK